MMFIVASPTGGFYHQNLYAEAPISYYAGRNRQRLRSWSSFFDAVDAVLERPIWVPINGKVHDPSNASLFEDYPSARCCGFRRSRAAEGGRSWARTCVVPSTFRDNR